MTIPALLAITAGSAIACGVLLVAEWRHHPTLRIGAKAFASVLFVVLGLVLLVSTFDVDGSPGWASYGRWMLGGLVLGMVGDLALLGRSNRAFLAGLIAFLLGHCAYIVGFAQLAPPRDWLAVAGIYAAAPVVTGLAALAVLWRSLKTMKLPVIVYVTAIITMVIGAIAVARGSEPPLCSRALLATGASLFFVSDLAVARDKFHSKTLANKLWGLPAYYAGQLLIAWSLASPT